MQRGNRRSVRRRVTGRAGVAAIAVVVLATVTAACSGGGGKPKASSSAPTPTLITTGASSSSPAPTRASSAAPLGLESVRGSATTLALRSSFLDLLDRHAITSTGGAGASINPVGDESDVRLRISSGHLSARERGTSGPAVQGVVHHDGTVVLRQGRTSITFGDFAATLGPTSTLSASVTTIGRTTRTRQVTVATLRGGSVSTRPGRASITRMSATLTSAARNLVDQTFGSAAPFAGRSSVPLGTVSLTVTG